MGLEEDIYDIKKSAESIAFTLKQEQKGSRSVAMEEALKWRITEMRHHRWFLIVGIFLVIVAVIVGFFIYDIFLGLLGTYKDIADPIEAAAKAKSDRITTGIYFGVIGGTLILIYLLLEAAKRIAIKKKTNPK